uniref:Endo/exonuclease/phosphatase domain-containing protein n=1 Tax=Angiostrongylus cantonensis TaxID=6313 RepID=A0A0K0DKX8_ANGCA
MVTICTYNARTLASESSIEDLLTQARMIRYDVIDLAETRRRHPFNAVYNTGELFLGTCDSRGVGGVGVLVNTSLSMNIDSFEQLTTRIGRLRLKRCGSTPALTIFVVYELTSNYDEEEVLHGLGEVPQRRPYILQGHHWRFQCQDRTKKIVRGTSHWDPRIRMERTG